MIELSTQDADDFYGCDKWILDNIYWEIDGIIRRFDVPVFTQLGEPLSLRGSKGRSHYSFALLFRNQIPIRRWDFKHRGMIYKVKQDNKIIREVIIPEDKSHKHRWDEELMDRDIYVVDIEIGEVNNSLKQFLEESNIELRGRIQYIFG